VPYSWNLKSRENVAWHSPVPRKGYSSPVLNGGKIFVTGADNQARDLYCFDLATGNLLWTLAATGIAGSPSAMPETTDDTGLAAPTPATNGKQVCAIFATGDLICADMDGQRLWAKNLGVPQNHYGYASSLLAYGSTLFVQYANSVSPRILALDMATGAEKWVKTLADKIAWSSPSLAYTDGKPMLVVAGNPAITAYNLSNGEQLWRVEGLSGEVASSPCSAGGLVFGAAEYAAVIAVNATTGEKLWSVNDYMPETSSPAATADHVYVATSYGVLASYDTKTGALQQQLELGGEFYSSPMLVEGKLFLFSNGGTFHAYALGSELKPLASFDTGERTFATPAFTDGYMVVRTEGNLYCVTKN
jgi:outer membrane protein assembly factor BamB